MSGSIKIVTKMSQLNDTWVVYQLTDPINAEPVFIGCCQLANLFNMPDVVRNPLFDREKLYSLTTLNILQGRSAAMNYQDKAVKQHTVIFGGYPSYNHAAKLAKRGKVVCNETGEVFYSLQDAARQHLIDPGALSKHLNNKPGFKTIKQRTYFYQK